jgi:hypothetical protein
MTMDEHDTELDTDRDAERGDRPVAEGTIFPPAAAMAGAVAPVAGLAAVLTPGMAGGLTDADDDAVEARGARVEKDPPTDPSEPAR